MLLSVVVCSAFVVAGNLIVVDRVGVFRPFVGGILGSCYQFIFGMLVCDLYVKSRDSISLKRFYSRGLLPGLMLMIAAFMTFVSTLLVQALALRLRRPLGAAPIDE